MEVDFFNIVFESPLAGAVKRMKILGAVILILWLPRVFAAGSVKAVSLLTSSAYVTQRLLPFSVEAIADGAKVPVLSVQVAPPCDAMVDKFYPHIFHVYCSAATNAKATFTYQLNGELKAGALDLENIRAVAILSTNPPPGPKEPSEVEIGQGLFQTYNCIGCHGAGQHFNGSYTAATIESNFTDSPDSTMKSYKGQISATDRSALAAYINSRWN